MQRVSPRASLIGLAAIGGLIAAMLVVFMLSLGSQTSPKAFAVATPPTNTPGPAPTPKVNNGGGPLSGVSDILVTAQVAGCTDIDSAACEDLTMDAYHCIARTDQDSAALNTNIKIAVTCYVNGGGPTPGGPQAEPPGGSVPGEGIGPAPVAPGPPPPPPYSPFPPLKILAHIDGAGALISVGGFCDIGGPPLGPNLVSVATIPNALAQNSATVGSFSTGHVALYLGVTNAVCDAAQQSAAIPAGSPTISLPLRTTRAAATRDFDGDGCTDSDELWQNKAGSTTKCGDDPWNPNDPTGASPNVSGTWDISAEAARADFGVPGFYYGCVTDIQQSGKALTAKILCYIDSPSITVNPQAAGSATAGVNNCTTVSHKFCGDGYGGASPPGCVGAPSCTALPPSCPVSGSGAPQCVASDYQFADVDSKHSVLTGVLDNTTNTMNLSGCFEDLDGFGALGSVYATAKINAHTGVGIANAYIAQTTANCTGGTPTGSPSVLTIVSVRQAPGAGTPLRDSDGDGCSDRKELSDTQATGGLRDPSNRWDFFDPEKTNTRHIQRVADILKVVGAFGKDQGNAAYTIGTDRTGLGGGNAWNLGPPNGQQRVDDILAAVKQFNQDCT